MFTSLFLHYITEIEWQVERFNEVFIIVVSLSFRSYTINGAREWYFYCCWKRFYQEGFQQKQRFWLIAIHAEIVYWSPGCGILYIIIFYSIYVSLGYTPQLVNSQHWYQHFCWISVFLQSFLQNISIFHYCSFGLIYMAANFCVLFC